MPQTPKTDRKELTPFDRGKIVGANIFGHGQYEISRFLGHSHTSTTVEESVKTKRMITTTRGKINDKSTFDSNESGYSESLHRIN